MRTMIKSNLIFSLVLLMVAGSTQAISVTGLDTDPLAMTGQQGRINVSTTGPFICDMTFAVYDLFDTSKPYDSFDPSLGTDQYLYAYQVFNLPGSTVDLTSFSVAIPAGITASNIAYDWMKAQRPGIPSSTQQFVDGSAEWLFNSNNNIALAATKNSVVLIYTSDFAPGISDASFETTGTGYIGANVPAPTPEPLSIVLFGAGAAAVLRKRAANV